MSACGTSSSIFITFISQFHNDTSVYKHTENWQRLTVASFQSPVNYVPDSTLMAVLHNGLCRTFKKNNNKNIALMMCVCSHSLHVLQNKCKLQHLPSSAALQLSVSWNSSIGFPITCCIKERSVMARQQTTKSTDCTDVGRRFAPDTWSVQSRYKSLRLSRPIHAKPDTGAAATARTDAPTRTAQSHTVLFLAEAAWYWYL